MQPMPTTVVSEKVFSIYWCSKKKALFNNGPWSLLFDLGKAREEAEARKRDEGS